ncbi:hypothetical protein BCF44_107365 [Kutzneria buriramensis]|uniref:Uncharacterized protein n=1 Tax=Kutzneria buriramensis TaxID=1045776 RepID=A0A3E0HIL3_9PSEU|nr:hypothetical protein BCF44_107365 [Kutzneria buriramensis]
MRLWQVAPVTVEVNRDGDQESHLIEIHARECRIPKLIGATQSLSACLGMRKWDDD